MCRRGRGLIGSRIKNAHLSDGGVLQSVRKCDVLTVHLLAKGHQQLVGRNPPPRETDTRLDCLGPEDTLYPQSGDRRISCHHSHIEAGVQSGKDPIEILVAQRQCPGETGVIRGLERGVVEPVNNFHWPHSRVFHKAQMLSLYYWQSTSQGQGHGAAKHFVLSSRKRSCLLCQKTVDVLQGYIENCQPPWYFCPELAVSEILCRLGSSPGIHCECTGEDFTNSWLNIRIVTMGSWFHLLVQFARCESVN